MQLAEVLRGNEKLLYMERYVDEGTKTYSSFAAESEVAPVYRPRSGKPSFGLICVHIPLDRVSIYKAEPAERLVEQYIRPDRVEFLIHPETWSDPDVAYINELHHLERGKAVRVVPTASTRTVLTQPIKGSSRIPPHFIKLHYPRRISRFNRDLLKLNISTSIASAQDISHVNFERFALLPDTLGFAYGDGEDAWGFLVREATPRPFREGRYLIPYFALYAGDLKRPNDLPLLVQMIERLGVDPVSFTVEEIMIPVLECWTKVVRERGFLLESHGQNILQEVDNEFRPQRVVHRDFDIYGDPEARKQAGLDMPFSGTWIGSDSPHPREQFYSLIYDRFIGQELFSYFLELLKHFYAADESRVHQRIAEAFHHNFPEARSLLPGDTTFYFSDEILPEDNFRLVDTGQRPQWR